MISAEDDKLREAFIRQTVTVRFRAPGAHGSWRDGSCDPPTQTTTVRLPDDTVFMHGAALINVRHLRGTNPTNDVDHMSRERCVPNASGEFVECPKRTFLEMDFYDSLRWLFVAARRWDVAPESDKPPLDMFAALVHARALYEFFYKDAHDDSALARHFLKPLSSRRFNLPLIKDRGTGTRALDPLAQSLDSGGLYAKYMIAFAPAQKRVFHLPYDRSEHAGGPGHDAKTQIKWQVARFAEDIHRLTTEFIDDADPDYRLSVGYALTQAEEERRK